MTEQFERFRDSLAARYTIEREVGRGGMATVYLARDLKHHRPVAIKILRPELAAALTADRFLREIELVARLNHPHILPLHDSGEAAGSLYYVMPYVEGESLRAGLDRGTRLPLEDALRICREVADALVHAHRRGIVHRDVKPENILLAEGHAVVTDFGIARAVDAVAGERLTETGLVVGTAAYMSPEQASGEPVGSATDIFSLGIVLYELATGCHPFAARSGASVLQGILCQPALPPSRLDPEIPTSLDAVVLQMLGKDPEPRPSATEVQRALADLVRKEPGPVTAAPRAPAERHTVGRARERAQLRGGFDAVLARKGVLLCVAGEPGIGKTTLVEDFLEEIAVSRQHCRVMRGRCSERLAGSEAYLPILEALEDLLHGKSGEEVARTLRLVAPTWHTQVVPLSAQDTSTARLLRDSGPASQERMKRELLAFFREASRLQPLVLFLDDVHWADGSTVDLISYLASHFESLPLLLVLSYRPSELQLAKHPFSQIKLDLQTRGVCREVILPFLGLEDVGTYLALEYPQHCFPPALQALIHAKTEGSPLFMVDLIRYLRDRRVIEPAQSGWALVQSIPDVERELPESVRSMIQKKVDQLDESDRHLLAVASAQGAEFDSAVIAQALNWDPEKVEDRLQLLDRVHAFVQLIGEREFPDRTPTLRYRFVHVLYQNALYSSLTPTRARSWSAVVAQSLLDHYGDRTPEIAVDLAILFETARDFDRGAQYFLVAAQQAADLFANQEVVALARRGLDMLARLPDTPGRALREMRLQMTLGAARSAIDGAGSPDAGRAYARAHELWRQSREDPELFPVLGGLWGVYVVRGDLQRARAIGEEQLRLAERTQIPTMLVSAHWELGITLHHLAEQERALEHLDRAFAMYRTEQRPFYVTLLTDPGVASRCESARALWVLGYPDQALHRLDEALSLAEQVAHPESLAFACLFGAFLNQLCGNVSAVLRNVEAVLLLSKEHEITTTLSWVKVLHGWALAARGRVDEGIGLLRESLAQQRAAGSEIARPQFLALLAEACLSANRVAAGMIAVNEGIEVANQTADRYWDAELHRLRGELFLVASEPEGPQIETPDPAAEAEACFRRALAVSREQHAKSFELRAATSLSRLWRNQGNAKGARSLLLEVYRWFSEGMGTADLVAARALLDLPNSATFGV